MKIAVWALIISRFPLVFDTVVISEPIKIYKRFGIHLILFTEQLSWEWHCSMVLGATFGGIPTNKIGKKEYTIMD
jgi:hypothetical protein